MNSRGLEPGDPTSIGRFRVLRRIGVGGMSIVYRAYDPELDRQIALKLLSSRGYDKRARQRMKREARAMAKVTHPNVVPIFDVGDFRESVYIAMELVEGVTLKDWVRETPRTWREILGMFMQAGRGLGAAHRAGLVHRDFKPSNVLVGDDGRPRVVDFGLARTHVSMTDDSGELVLPAETNSDVTIPDGIIDTQITATGFIPGTPAYMSPEQHMGEMATPASDQFSFSVSLWEGLYRERPFQGKTAFAVAHAITEGDIVEPFIGRVPRWVHTIVRRGIEVDPRDRHPSIQSMLASVVFTSKVIYGA